MRLVSKGAKKSSVKIKESEKKPEGISFHVHMDHAFEAYTGYLSDMFADP